MRTRRIKFAHGLVACGALASLAVALRAHVADAAVVPFVSVVVDTAGSGDCKGAGDLDGDGFVDGVLGGATLAWYRSPQGTAGSFTRYLIADADVEYSTDCQVVDVNDDGALDIVVPDSNRLRWYENPGAGVGVWSAHEIGQDATWMHDVQVAHLNLDGRIDVVTRREGSTDIWLQGAASSPGGPPVWTHRTVSTLSGEGTAVGDVDMDGDVDIVAGGTWLEHPSQPLETAGPWAAHPIAAIAAGPLPVANLTWGSVTVADMDGNGRNDIVYGPMEATGRKLAWYSSADATTWTEHLIAPGQIAAGLHNLVVADIDRDGLLDVVTARMHTYAPSSVSVWTRTTPTTWSEQVVGQQGMHNPRVADFGRDGDLDIFGSNYVGTAPLRLYRNELPAPLPPAAPTDATATSSAASIVVTWTDRSDNEAGFEVLRARWNATAMAWMEWSTISTTAGAVSYTDGNVPDGQYAYLVRAVNAFGSSAWSAAVVISHSTSLSPPQPVADLTATGQAGSIALHWTHGGPDEFGFEVMRTRWSPSTLTWGEWTSWALDRDVTGFVDTTPSDAVLAYLVRAHNPRGASAWSIVRISYTGDGEPPSPPSDLRLGQTGGSVSVLWTDQADNEQGFEVMRARFDPSSGGWTGWAAWTVDRDLTELRDVSVSAGTYAYLVRSYNSNATSAWSIDSIIVA